MGIVRAIGRKIGQHEGSDTAKCTLVDTIVTQALIDLSAIAYDRSPPVGAGKPIEHLSLLVLRQAQL
jgi:hypothetical protein